MGFQSTTERDTLNYVNKTLNLQKLY